MDLTLYFRLDIICENSEWIRARMEDASLDRGSVGMCCIVILSARCGPLLLLLDGPLEFLLVLLNPDVAVAAAEGLLLDASSSEAELVISLRVRIVAPNCRLCPALIFTAINNNKLNLFAVLQRVRFDLNFLALYHK